MIYTFDSTQAGAPVLSGTPGALRSLLRACLVDGFGAGAVATLTVAGGVATATFAGAHPYTPGRIAEIFGATPAALNGRKLVTATTGNSIQFAAPGVPDGAATGTISHKVAGAGWQELFAGTLANVIALKPSVPEATGCVLRVDDTGATNARVRAYEAMSDISAGVGPTPLESQVAGGLWWPKSDVANATARPWCIVADARGVYLAVAPQGNERFTLLFSGDIASFKSGDAYGYLLTGNGSDQTYTSSPPDGCCGYTSRADRVGAYLARSYTAIGQAVAARRIGAHHTGPLASVYAGTSDYAWGSYPNGANNGLMTAPLELINMGLRGTLPGLLHPVQDCGNAFVSGAVISGTDDMLGRDLMVLRVGTPALGSLSVGTVMLDVTGPWSR